MLSTPPTLWIVSTPIGNIDDLSPRARAVLANADLILAEDTRRAGRLLAAAGIRGRVLLSFFEHNEKERQEEVLREMAAGKNVALITDAGTPLMADPGYRLVRACRQQGFSVSPIPGPSAILAALAACGIAPLPFTFLGFMPRSAPDRQRAFGTFKAVPTTLVFFERKNRAAETLALAYDVLGDRELAIARELTKTHEEFLLGKLADGPEIAAELLGELTIVIGPPLPETKTSPEKVLKLLEEALNTEGKPKVAARKVKELVHGWSVGDLYNLLTHRSDGEL